MISNSDGGTIDDLKALVYQGSVEYAKMLRLVRTRLYRLRAIAGGMPQDDPRYDHTMKIMDRFEVDAAALLASHPVEFARTPSKSASEFADASGLYVTLIEGMQLITRCAEGGSSSLDAQREDESPLFDILGESLHSRLHDEADKLQVPMRDIIVGLLEEHLADTRNHTLSTQEEAKTMTPSRSHPKSVLGSENTRRVLDSLDIREGIDLRTTRVTVDWSRSNEPRIKVTWLDPNDAPQSVSTQTTSSGRPIHLRVISDDSALDLLNSLFM